MANLHKFTTKEILNKVLLDSSGTPVAAFSHTTQEALNAVLDTTNNRLNVSIAGGTISGDVTISGDLTVSGGGSLSFDEILEGTQVIDVTNTEAFLVRKNSDGGDVFIVDTTNTHVGIAVAPSYPLHVQGGYEVLAQFAGGNAQLNIDQSASGVIDLNVPSSGDILTLSTQGNEAIRINASQQIGIGTASPSSLLDISHSGSTTKSINLTRTVTGNTTYTNRAVKFDINKTSTMDSGATLTYDGMHIDFDDSGADNAGSTVNLTGLKVDVNSDDATGTTKNVGLNVSVGGADTNYAALFSGGNVGIGADAPLQPLHIKVDNSNSDPHFLIENDNSGGRSHMGFRNSSRSTYWTFGQDSDNDLKFANHVHFGSNVRMTLTTGGNLGIGTDSPSKPLHISGSSGQDLLIQSSSAGSRLQMEGATTADIILKDTGGSSGAKYTQLRTGDDSFKIRTLTDAGDVGNEMIHLDLANNRIGIGTDSPTHTLHALSTENKAFLLDRNTANNGTSLNELSSYYSLSIKNRASGSYLNFAGDSTHTSLQATDGESSAAAKILTLNPYGGNVGIGTVSPSGDGLTGSASPALEISGTYPVLQLHDTDDANYKAVMGTNSGIVYLGGTGSAITALQLYVQGGLKMKLDNDSRISLSNNDSGASNTIFGNTSGANIASGGDKNTLYGKSTGYSISTGDNNTNLGWEAGYYNATGSYNTAVGSGSMMGASGQSHSDNTAVGYYALKEITTGGNNVAVGANALNGITTKGNNVALGYNAMNGVTNTQQAIAIGSGALDGLSSAAAEGHVAIGHNALGAANSNGSNGAVAIGHSALQAVTSQSGNTAVGVNAGISVASAGNTLFGHNAGNLLTSGGNNTLIGYEADADVNSDSYQVKIGSYGIIKYKTARVTLNNYTTPADGDAAHANSLFNIPSYSYIHKITVKVTTLSATSAAVFNIQKSATLDTAAGTALGSPVELLGAGVNTTHWKVRSSATQDAASDIIASNSSNSGVLNSTWVSTNQNADDSTGWIADANSGAGWGIYVAHAGSNTGDAGADAVLDIMVEYY